MKKIGILILAHNVEKTIHKVLDRIPSEIKDKCKDIFIFDDCSTDGTYYSATGYKYYHKIRKISIFKNRKNMGYGGNQKEGYNYAIKKGYDIVVMLHGDVQYAPEKIPELIKPLENDEADAVFGSRIIGNPLKGGMPIWRYIGNRVLTFLENKSFDMIKPLSEFHSGFRAYSCEALKDIPFNKLSNDFVFDTEIIINLNEKRKRILEIQIPTHYGEESQSMTTIKSIKYGWGILKIIKNYLKFYNKEGGVK